ncbi:unnamed protein product [Prunus armeniaca]
MQNLQKYLASKFEIKSLDDLKYFLGIEVARSKYETGMLDCKPIDTPSDINNLVTLRSKKQKVVFKSSVEAKYRGMAQGVCELLWLRRLLRNLEFGLGVGTVLYGTVLSSYRYRYRKLKPVWYGM